MKWKFATTLAVALALPLTLAAAADAQRERARPGFRTLEEMTRSIEVTTRPDGTTVTTRVFTEGIPYEEYLAALAELNQTGDSGITPPAAEGEELRTLSGVCIPPDQDYDGDGLVGAEDTFPTSNGEYVADRYRFTTELDSYIRPAIDVKYTSETTFHEEYETYESVELTALEKVSDTLEIKKVFNSNAGVKLAFGQGEGDDSPSFTFDLSFGESAQLERTHTYTWTKERSREAQAKFVKLRKDEEDGSLEIGPDSGHVSGFTRLIYAGDAAITVEVTNVVISVVGYSPFTGQREAIGQQTFSGPYTLGYGDGNNSVTLFVDMQGLNTYWFLNGMAEGWVYDFELSNGFSAVDIDSGENVTALNTSINGRTARISIHDGEGGEPRMFGRVSVFQPNDQCLTAKTMLETFVGAENVEFDRLDDGSLVVTRIGDRENVHADRNFDDLTPAEQAEYGRWIVGFDFADNHILPRADLENEYLIDEDQVFFYYLTADDYELVQGPPSATLPFAVANDGTQPSEQVVLPAALEQDVIEFEGNSEFFIQQLVTHTYSGGVYTDTCGILYGATLHYLQDVADSRYDDYPVPDPDFFGMEVKFGGMEWMDIDTLMSEESAQAELVDFRGYPYYDFVVRFLVSPELLGGYPVRDFQVRNVRQRQSFYVGWEGYDVAGRYHDCRHWETVGYFHDYGSARIWYKIDNVDGDLDTFYSVSKGGIDFDDADDKRFPYAPEHLDFIDNDGDSDVDEEPLQCPHALLSNNFGTCVLDDRMGWYGDSPNIGMEARWHYIDGSTGDWANLGSISEYTFFMPDQPNLRGLELQATNYAVAGNPSGSNLIVRADSCTDADGDTWTTCDGDCDDANADTHPGASEICDGADNDCDGVLPPDEFDADGDGYSVCAGDCNDGNHNINPGASENCQTSADDDCDGYVNEGCGGGSPIFRKPIVQIQAE